MKYLLTGELGFEAVSNDQALIKLALHLITKMEKKPIIFIDSNHELDLIEFMIKEIPSIVTERTTGFISIFPMCDHSPPKRLQ